MTRYDDLRATLAEHADAVEGAGHPERWAGIQQKARAGRRRRRATIAGAAVATLAVVGGVALWPGAGPDVPDPSGAPETMTSLGYTYALQRAETGEGEASVTLPAKSPEPYLISWGADDGEVTLDFGGYDLDANGSGPDVVTEDSTDFSEFHMIDPGQLEERTVTASGAGEVTLAVYGVSEPAPGVTSNGVTFRHDLPSVGERLVAAEFGEPGDTELSFTFELPDPGANQHHVCYGAPEGTSVVTWIDGIPGGATVPCGAQPFDSMSGWWQRGTGRGEQKNGPATTMPGAGPSGGWSTGTGDAYQPGSTVTAHIKLVDSDDLPEPDFLVGSLPLTEDMSPEELEEFVEDLRDAEPPTDIHEALSIDYAALDTVDAPHVRLGLAMYSSTRFRGDEKEPLPHVEFDGHAWALDDFVARRDGQPVTADVAAQDGPVLVGSFNAAHSMWTRFERDGARIKLGQAFTPRGTSLPTVVQWSGRHAYRLEPTGPTKTKTPYGIAIYRQAD